MRTTARQLFAAFHVAAAAVAAPLPPLPEPRPWDEYRTILWISDATLRHAGGMPLLIRRLREMGVNTGMVFDGADPAPWVERRFPYYVENIVNKGLCLKWSSNVRDWDAFVTKWRQTGDRKALVRDYSFDDSAWRTWALGEARATARRHRAHAPLAYDLRDELSVTISANPFDYDFAPVTLAAFRDWLRERHGDLAALNRAWATDFASWDDVRPFTTDEIKSRMAGGGAMPRGQPDWQAVRAVAFDPAAARRDPVRWNFAPWAEFRTFMDGRLAQTLDDLRRAARAEDPATPVGIEGTQMPHAFGGYDLWKLSQALDWVEPYDVGNARPIFGSFMPGKPVLCTLGDADTNRARRKLWHLLLEGDRGCIVWWSEDCLDAKAAELPLTAKARALAPALGEMTGPLARLFLRARRQSDPVAIHYSQASLQVDWLMESIPDGRTWHRRFSSYEAEHNRMAARRNGWLQDLRNAGYSPRFVSYEQIEGGELARGGYRFLVMSDSWALSDREAAQLKAFADGGGRLVYEGVPGEFDEIGRLRAKPAELPAAAGTNAAAVAAALPAAVRVTPAEARTAVYRYRLGEAELIALERNVSWHSGEDLKERGGEPEMEKPVGVTAHFEKCAATYDLRRVAYLGMTNAVALALDPWQPALLARLPAEVPPERVIERLSEAAR